MGGGNPEAAAQILEPGAEPPATEAGRGGRGGRGSGNRRAHSAQCLALHHGRRERLLHARSGGPNIIWSSASGNSSVGGIVSLFDERNHPARNGEVWPEQTSGSPAADLKYRFNWEFPLTISPHHHNKVYMRLRE